MKGVVDTVVGYSGGKQSNPTYQSIKDSTESILIEYDPKLISYADILDHWKLSARGYPGMKRQYRSAVFYSDMKEKTAAENVVDKMIASNGGKDVYIDIEPVSAFYRAEEYHQHYMAKRLNGQGQQYGCVV